MEYTEEDRLRTVQDVVKQTKKYANRLQTQDIIAIGCVTTVLPVSYLLEIFYVLPFYYPTFSEAWILRVSLLSYLALNLYLNIYKIVRVGPNGSGAPLPTVIKPGYRYCHSCQLNSPPRAYHCPVCDICVFRRDHHCSFAATCIGHFNQRYFVAGVANLWVVIAVCLYWNWHLIFLTIPKFTALQVWQLMVPHVALMAGFLTMAQFVNVFFFVSSLTAWLFVSYLVAAQFFCIYRGQTRVEYLLDIFAYNCGFHENLRQALGTRWPLIFISPFLPSPLPSDGVSFRAFDSTDISKETKYL